MKNQKIFVLFKSVNKRKNRPKKLIDPISTFESLRLNRENVWRGEFANILSFPKNLIKNSSTGKQRYFMIERVEQFFIFLGFIWEICNYLGKFIQIYLDLIRFELLSQKIFQKTYRSIKMKKCSHIFIGTNLSELMSP
jgi:hypothetical protein